MAQKQDKDLKKIKQILEIMKENDLVEVELVSGEHKIHLKSAKSVQPQPQPQIITAAPAAGGQQMQNVSAGEQGESQQQADDNLIEIKSPIVGTFYHAPSPDSEPFVEVGSKVEEDTVVCIVEAMKVMNEIKAEVEGTVTEILVKNGQAVEFDQPVFKVKPE
jgi:acetyl-CoA carboxylase biotin carboxyl carrier protein